MLQGAAGKSHVDTPVDSFDVNSSYLNVIGHATNETTNSPGVTTVPSLCM